MSASASRSLWSRLQDVAALATTPLTPSHFLELALPLEVTHKNRAKVVSVVRENEKATTIELAPSRGFQPHKAGQWVSVGVVLEGRLVQRAYSFTSAPERAIDWHGGNGRTFTITVHAVGKVSNHLAHHVKPGDYVALGQPSGEFVLPEAPTGSILFVTGGSGITPVMGMLRSFEARGAFPDVVHVHYARTREEALFQVELQRLAAEFPSYRYRFVATDEPSAAADDDLRQMSAGTLTRITPDALTRECWVCGPESLTDATIQCFADAGQESSVHVERFRPKRVRALPVVESGVVTFSDSGVNVQARGGSSLLELAEAAGVQAKSGCRMGICHSCDTRLVSGCVRDVRTGRRIDEPGELVQLCVCAPSGDVDLAL